MSWLGRFRARSSTDLFEAEMDEELRFHLESQIDDAVKAGMTPDEARRTVLMNFGGIDRAKDACRDTRWAHYLDDLSKDLFYAMKLLRRNPGFALMVIITLGLGIGATTAIFAVVNGVLLRPLPYPEPERLVYMNEYRDRLGINPFASGLEFIAWKKQSRTLSGISAYMDSQANLSGESEAQRVNCGLATAGFFPLLGIKPSIGRIFREEEDRPGAPLVVILSHSLWTRHYGGDRNILGKTLTLDSKTYTVIGVLPAGFRVADRYSFDYDLWIPMSLNEGDRRACYTTLVRIIGRLGPGATIKSAESELDVLMPPALKQLRKARVVLTPLHDEVVADVRLSLLVFLAATGLVLLIACVNVATLLLSRATEREKEIAVRCAVGAGTFRLLRQFLTESVVMALAGGVAGLMFAFWIRRLLVAFISPNLPSMEPIGFDHRVLGFNFILSMVTALIFGLVPVIQTWEVGLNESLKEGGRNATQGRRNHRLRSFFVTAEISFAIILLIGAGLLLKSFVALRGIDPGFKLDRILSLTVTLTPSAYPKPEDRFRFYQLVIERIRGLQHVQSVGVSSCIPFGGNAITISGLKIAGRPASSQDEQSMVSFSAVNADYFRTLGIPVHSGRIFVESAVSGASEVVVSESFVRRYFPNESPIGMQVKAAFSNRKDDLVRIVGVVGDVHQSGLERAAKPQLYCSYLQATTEFMSFAIQTDGDPLELTAAVRSQIAGVDRSQPPYDLMTLEQRLSKYLAPRRVNMLLVGSFAALALLLALIGVYGVVSHSVTQRTHEIGIRVALGASRGDVTKTVVRQALGLSVVGTCVGLGGAFCTTRLITSLLFGTTPTDPTTFIAVTIIMMGVVFLASYIPSLRAGKIDPMIALRHE
jgi:putative ABC transport system permease protein